MPLSLQVKLLRVLQEREVTPIGGVETFKLDVQIIAATNKNIEKLVEEGQFREDLYYRLHVVPIHIPPLRERPEEIPYLVQYFLNHFNGKYQTRISITKKAMDKMKSLPWFGNVRELENVMERIVVTADAPQVDECLLTQYIPDQNSSKPSIIIKKLMPLNEAIESLEEQLIIMAMKQYNSSIMAAKVLEVSQPTLSRKYKKIKEKLDAKHPSRQRERRR